MSNKLSVFTLGELTRSDNSAHGLRRAKLGLQALSAFNEANVAALETTRSERELSDNPARYYAIIRQQRLNFEKAGMAASEIFKGVTGNGLSKTEARERAGRG